MDNQWNGCIVWERQCRHWEAGRGSLTKLEGVSRFIWNPVRMEVPNLRKNRKRFSCAEKAAIPREHPIDHVPVSEPCNKHGILPTLF